MKYLQKSFTFAAGSPAISDEDWARAFSNPLPPVEPDIEAIWARTCYDGPAIGPCVCPEQCYAHLPGNTGYSECFGFVKQGGRFIGEIVAEEYPDGRAPWDYETALDKARNNYRRLKASWNK